MSEDTDKKLRENAKRTLQVMFTEDITPELFQEHLARLKAAFAKSELTPESYTLFETFGFFYVRFATVQDAHKAFQLLEGAPALQNVKFERVMKMI